MVELLEYALAVMVSTLLVAGSVAVYESFTSYEEDLQLEGTLATVSGIAEAALSNGSARAAVSLPASTIGCEGNTLYVGIGAASMSQGIGVRCDFQVDVTAGVHVLSFTAKSGQLGVMVT